MDTETNKHRPSVIIRPQNPELPTVAITRNSTASTPQTPQAPFNQPRRTSTFDSSIGPLQMPPTTPLGLSNANTDAYPFPYATRSATNDVSLYPTTTGYSQWADADGQPDLDEPTQAPDRLPDKAPRARPAVDYQDMLWTQIDILDDVRRMAEQSTADGSFFSAEHAKALAELRRTQYSLMDGLKDCEKALDDTDDHKVIWDSNDINSVRERLYNRDYFDGVKKGLENVKLKLDEVGEAMRKVDDRREH